MSPAMSKSSASSLLTGGPTSATTLGPNSDCPSHSEPTSCVPAVRATLTVAADEAVAPPRSSKATAVTLCVPPGSSSWAP
jgi:hypothetical protein